MKSHLKRLIDPSVPDIEEAESPYYGEPVLWEAHNMRSPDYGVGELICKDYA